MILLALSAVTAAVPIAIWVGDWWHVHRNMDTVAHVTSGVSLGALALVVIGGVWLPLVAVLAVALAWEWVEPRIPQVESVGYQDTEADILAVVMGAALVVLWVVA